MSPKDRAFYDHPFIQSIKDIPNWSVSDINKRPIDYLSATHNNIRGCNPANPQSMATLDKWLTLFKSHDGTPLIPANHAFYLEAITHDFLVLDIEPACPSNLKLKLLELPYIYGQKSTSGKGIHLIFPLTKELILIEDLFTRDRIQHPKKYYELLINHWVTFTRNMIPNSTKDKDDQEDFYLFVKKALENLPPVKKAKPIEYNEKNLTDILHYETILKTMGDTQYFKRPEDFHNDMSKWEYGYIARIYQKLLRVLKTGPMKIHTYTDQEIITLLYFFVIKEIPHREKHNGIRNGLPYLLQECCKYVARQKRG